VKGVANVIEYRRTSYKLLIVEGREEVIPFVLRIKGSSSVKSKIDLSCRNRHQPFNGWS